MDFLSEIIAAKRRRLTAAKARLSLAQVRSRAYQVRAPEPAHRLAEVLRSAGRVNLIAEFKRRSPSKGRINARADAAATAKIYEAAGAAAISVLTEEDYFDGSLEDLRRVREVASLPVLRKDFIFDEYQIYESAAAGADAVLLIAAALDDQTLRDLRVIAEEELGLDALVEVHTKAELERAMSCGARLIGVNNRDLRTFAVSISVSEQLAKVAPRDAILISESGLDPEAVRKLRAFGYRGFLVGETLMRAENPGRKLREFIEESEGQRSSRSVWVKICGVTNIEDARAAIAAGADMLGFNFYRQSPRFIDPKVAGKIIHEIRSQLKATSPPVSMIGVYVNESIDDVLRFAAEAGVNGIQLHGDENVEYCKQLKTVSEQRFVIKALSRDADLNFETMIRYPTDALMVDAFDANLRGGTGRVADWTRAREAAKTVGRLFLAGGLSPENVGEAIAAVGPYAVDACSSLETAPGKKSAERMKEFVEAVRTSKLQDETSAGEGD